MQRKQNDNYFFYGRVNLSILYIECAHVNKSIATRNELTTAHSEINNNYIY